MISKVKRKPKVVTTKLQTGDIFKLVGIPHKFNNGYIWITGMAVSKSTRALNDWMKQLLRIYTKWFEKHENIPWVISEKHRSFFFYKKRT